MDKLVFVIGKVRRTRDVDLYRAKQLALGWKTEGVSEIKIYALPTYSETEAYVPDSAIEAALKTIPLAVVRPTYDCEKEDEPKQKNTIGRILVHEYGNENLPITLHVPMPSTVKPPRKS